MRITFLLLTVASLHVAAEGLSQGITFSINNGSILDAFKKIEEQSGYYFMYNKEQLTQAKPVTLHFVNASLQQALTDCFKGQPFTYAMQNKLIVVKEKITDRDKDILRSSGDYQSLIDVKGRVLNENEQPVAGVTVTVKGTSASTVTDANGEFRLATIEREAILIFTHVTMESFELKVNGKTELIVRLKPKISELGVVQIVSTGYQDIPKERATGSFTKIDNAILSQQVSTNILERLDGIVNGLAYNSKISSTFYEGLLIRGLSTIQGPRGPLIVVDNFPYNGDIGNINPNEVESITVLKDAAATSIWGTQAGNGVIVITTRKGSFNQKTSIEFNSNITFIEEPDLYYRKKLTTSEYIDIETFLFEKGYYDGNINSNSFPALTPVVEVLIKKGNGQLSSAEAEAQINALRNIDVRKDFEKYLYQGGVNQQYYINAKGGTSNNSWFLSVGYDKNIDESKSGFERVNLRLNHNLKISDKLQGGTEVYLTRSKTGNGNPKANEITYLNNNLYPYAKLADDNGMPLSITKLYRSSFIDTVGAGKLLDWRYYPLEDHRHYTSNTNLQDILINAVIKYTPNKEINLEAKYQYEKQFIETQSHYDQENFFTRDLINRFSQLNRTTGQVTYIIPKGGILDLNNSNLESHNVRGQINVAKSWGRHNIVAIGGSEIRAYRVKSNSNRTYGYIDDILFAGNVDFVNSYPNIINGNPEFIPNNQSFNEFTNRFVSVYANAAYTYNGKYIVSLSSRRDASNLFGVTANEKWTPLWSTGIKWNLSKEKFYNSRALPILSFRATYGYNGNVDQSKSAVTTMLYRSSPSPYTQTPNAVVDQYANPSLQWEKIGMLNVGVDFELNNKSVTGSLEYYRKKGTNLFGLAPVDYTTGIGTVVSKNVASMEGHGIDVEINTINLNKSIKWYSTLIFNYNSDKVTDYFKASENGSLLISSPNSLVISALVGKPIYSIFSYKWAGLDPTTGSPQGYKNGHPSTDYNYLVGNSVTVDSIVYNGPAFPTKFGSLRNTFEWKGISLTANITYKFGYYFRRESINYSQHFLNGNGHADFSRRWQKPGDELLTTVPSLTYPTSSNRDQFYSGSEVLIEKGDHIRLQYISIAYQLENRFKVLPFSRLRLYCTMNNLGIIWRQNDKDLDPDYFSADFPPSRRVSLGINVNF